MPDPAPGAPLYACVYRPPVHAGLEPSGDLASLAQDFSPRFEIDAADLVSIDVSGLTRLFPPRAGGGVPEAIAHELRRAAADRGLRVHVAVAGTRTAALVLSRARPGVTVVPAGEEAIALAPLAIGMLEKVLALCARSGADATASRAGDRPEPGVGVGAHANHPAISIFRQWGLRTLGDLAALPPADLASRVGRAALEWQAIARGDDVRPLVPALDAERFEGRLDLEWPIDGLEPLSFVLTRLLEPIATRLERRDRGAAVLHVLLRLVSRDVHARRLELPTPMRDVRTLRTLALLDLEAHPPAAAIDRVTVVVDPTPARVLQHTLFARPQPTAEELSTLLARLHAVVGADRVGAPAPADTFRPGAFAMKAFLTAREAPTTSPSPPCQRPTTELSSALRRCRQPVPARVAVVDGRPVRVTTDRRGYAGGTVVRCAGPWRTSGAWWDAASWDRDEWDVLLSDDAVYRVFEARDTGAWFIDAIVD